jgi:hypothetical protein
MKQTIKEEKQLPLDKMVDGEETLEGKELQFESTRTRYNKLTVIQYKNPMNKLLT